MTVQASLGNLKFGLPGNLRRHPLPRPGSLIEVSGGYYVPVTDAASRRWEAEAQREEVKGAELRRASIPGPFGGVGLGGCLSFCFFCIHGDFSSSHPPFSLFPSEERLHPSILTCGILVLQRMCQSGHHCVPFGLDIVSYHRNTAAVRPGLHLPFTRLYSA